MTREGLYTIKKQTQICELGYQTVTSDSIPHWVLHSDLVQNQAKVIKTITPESCLVWFSGTSNVLAYLNTKTFLHLYQKYDL